MNLQKNERKISSCLNSILIQIVYKVSRKSRFKRGVIEGTFANKLTVVSVEISEKTWALLKKTSQYYRIANYKIDKKYRQFFVCQTQSS